VEDEAQALGADMDNLFRLAFCCSRMAFSSSQASSLNGNGLDFFSVSLCSIELSKVEPLRSVPSVLAQPEMER
jgi:hypothetical protein